MSAPQKGSRSHDVAFDRRYDRSASVGGPGISADRAAFLKLPSSLVFDSRHCYFLIVAFRDISITQRRGRPKADIHQPIAFGM